MEQSKITDDVRHRAREFERIGKIAARKAQEENRRLGLPNVYEDKDRRIYYELPDGTITYNCPFENEEKAP